MIEAERQVERRIAPPCTLRIQKDGTVGPAQDVFRAYIAVDQGALVGLGHLDQALQAVREVRMGKSGVSQVRLQPYVVEDHIGRKHFRE